MRTALYSDQAQLLEGPSPCGLRGVTYSEFDNKVGPRLKFQYPVDAISSDEFESFADYVIVGKHLCGKIITVRNDSVQFVNYSVAIDNRKYDRNTLLFAVGFVLDKDIDTVSTPLSACPARILSYPLPWPVDCAAPLRARPGEGSHQPGHGRAGERIFVSRGVQGNLTSHASLP